MVAATNSVPIPFPNNSAPGVRPNESAGRLINAYVGELQQGARSDKVWRRAPGLASVFSDTSQTGNRGQLLVGGLLYSAWGSNSGKVTSFDSSGALTTLTGNLTGTKKVTWAVNQNASPQVIAVDPDNGAFRISGTAMVSYNASGVLPAPNSVCFLDGYFFFTIGDNRCFGSALNDITVNSSTWIKCQGKSNVTLLRAVPFTDLYLCTTGSIEVWIDTAEATPGFPFSRSKVIPRGILNARSITGFEDGFAKGLIFTGDDCCVYALNGYSPVKISTPDVERSIAGLSTTDQATLEMFPYIVGGRSCIVIKATSFTWVYDLDSLSWHERASYQIAYWRPTGTVRAFGKWIAGDDAAGTLIEITDQRKDETRSALIWEVQSGPASAFPNKMAVPQAIFDIALGVGQEVGTRSTTVTGAASGTLGRVKLAVASTTGFASGDTFMVSGVTGTTEANGPFVGDVIDSTHIELRGSVFANAYSSGGTVVDMTIAANIQNPTVEVSWSDDGGISWGVPLRRPLGPQSDPSYPLKIAKTGMTLNVGRRWRLRVSDAVDVELTGGQMQPEIRAA